MMKFDNNSKKEIEEALIIKNGVEEFLKKYRDTPHGELKEWGINNGCEISTKYNSEVIFEPFITGSYRTHDGMCYHRKIRIECLNTGYTDMYNSDIYYDVKSKVLFTIKTIPADSDNLGVISIRKPHIVNEEILREYEEWKASCKKYNDEQVGRLSKLVGLSMGKIYKFKKDNGITTLQITQIYECLTTRYISSSMLEKFEKGDFKWDRYYSIFDPKKEYSTFGMLPHTRFIIALSLDLIGTDNNSILLENK